MITCMSEVPITNRSTDIVRASRLVCRCPFKPVLKLALHSIRRSLDLYPPDRDKARQPLAGRKHCNCFFVHSCLDDVLSPCSLSKTNQWPESFSLSLASYFRKHMTASSCCGQPSGRVATPSILHYRLKNWGKSRNTLVILRTSSPGVTLPLAIVGDALINHPPYIWPLIGLPI